MALPLSLAHRDDGVRYDHSQDLRKDADHVFGVVWLKVECIRKCKAMKSKNAAWSLDCTKSTAQMNQIVVS